MTTNSTSSPNIDTTLTRLTAPAALITPPLELTLEVRHDTAKSFGGNGDTGGGKI